MRVALGDGSRQPFIDVSELALGLLAGRSNVTPPDGQIRSVRGRRRGAQVQRFCPLGELFQAARQIVMFCLQGCDLVWNCA
jgi:hypothetical protein